MMTKERVYTINLGQAYDYTRTKRAIRAIKLIKTFLSRHMKVDKRDVKISNALNHFVWKSGICKPPRKVKIKVLLEGNVAYAYLFDEQIPRKEKEKEEKKEGKKERVKEKEQSKENKEGREGEEKAEKAKKEEKEEKEKEKKEPEKNEADVENKSE